MQWTVSSVRWKIPPPFQSSWQLFFLFPLQECGSL